MYDTYRRRFGPILDCLLADHNGIAAAAARDAAHKDPEAMPLLVIALTAWGDVDAALTALAAIPTPGRRCRGSPPSTCIRLRLAFRRVHGLRNGIRLASKNGLMSSSLRNDLAGSSTVSLW